MTMIYRGSKVVQSENVETKHTIPANSYVYRGIRHSGTSTPNLQGPQKGIYRGVRQRQYLGGFGPLF